LTSKCDLNLKASYCAWHIASWWWT